MSNATPDLTITTDEYRSAPVWATFGALGEEAIYGATLGHPTTTLITATERDYHQGILNAEREAFEAWKAAQAAPAEEDDDDE